VPEMTPFITPPTAQNSGCLDVRAKGFGLRYGGGHEYWLCIDGGRARLRDARSRAVFCFWIDLQALRAEGWDSW
jgi:hypothetical protein